MGCSDEVHSGGCEQTSPSGAANLPCGKKEAFGVLRSRIRLRFSGMTALAIPYLALVLFSLPCEAALSPNQLSAAVLNPSPDASLPLGVTFRNSTGSALTLGDAIGDKPAALILVDYTCRFICGTTLAVAAYGLSATDLLPGKDFSLVVMGIDPKDKAADAKAMKDAELAPYPALKAAAHFLNGDASAIAGVTKALNYTPVYDAETDEYAHPVGVVILTPGGRVSRLISGLNLNADSFKTALKEAGTAVSLASWKASGCFATGTARFVALTHPP